MNGHSLIQCESCRIRGPVLADLWMAIIQVMIGFLFFIQPGHAAMSDDYVLKFETHNLNLQCYGGITDWYSTYAGSPHHLCIDRVAREKTPEDATRLLN